MDKNKRELESLIGSQKEQLNRYEARLKDVVTAYKGLLKEKEALEASLSALTETKENPQTESKNQKASVATTEDNFANAKNDLQTQISTVMNSLATLSAEKSRMEASFQADKKNLRMEMMKKDETINSLHERNKELEKQSAVDLENMKSKVIVERHEREKESNNHMVMIRELQKLFSDERHLKENLEMQLNDLKQQISSSSTSNPKLKDLSLEIRDLREKLNKYESDETNEIAQASTTLQQLQSEMINLKKQHSIAIRTEQKRAHLAEERSKKQAALHEDRVQNLEARLAELSSTVGTYDRLRQLDQENIQSLKDRLQELMSSGNLETYQAPIEKPVKKDLQLICDEILQLKKILLIENARSSNPIDILKFFGQTNTAIGDHSQCQEDILKLQDDLDSSKLDCEKYQSVIDEHKRSIKILQEKVQVLNRNIDEQELELKHHASRLTQAIKAEKTKYKTELSSLESEYRGKISDLEHQLQKQRVRSLQLLEEKESEIKALKTSFEIFSPQLDIHTDVEKSRRLSTSHVQTLMMNSTNVNSGSTASGPENCHMLHYANEIARKDVEIAALRKAKYSVESVLRQALQDKVTTQEELHENIETLQEEVSRLERCKTREGANLEYLKNVFISFLSTSSLDGKKHMINAIAAVLQFSPAEEKAINSIIFNRK